METKDAARKKVLRINSAMILGSIGVLVVLLLGAITIIQKESPQNVTALEGTALINAVLNLNATEWKLVENQQTISQENGARQSYYHSATSSTKTDYRFFGRTAFEWYIIRYCEMAGTEGSACFPLRIPFPTKQASSPIIIPHVHRISQEPIHKNGVIRAMIISFYTPQSKHPAVTILVSQKETKIL